METNDISVAIKTKCDTLGWKYEIRNNVFKISKTFKKNDAEAFKNAGIESNQILRMMPTSSPYSIWGAANEMSNGIFTMNKSGCNKRVLNLLKKLL